MNRYILIIVFLICPLLVQAQSKDTKNISSEVSSQEAGTLVNTEEIFQKLIDKCDDVNLLMLRARIRLELPRIDKSDAEKVEKMLLEGFEMCAQKKPEEAQVKLTEAYDIAKKAASERFGQTGTGGLETVKKEVETIKDKDISNGTKDKPWWKFW
jgi:hypothetical protein